MSIHGVRTSSRRRWLAFACVLSLLRPPGGAARAWFVSGAGPEAVAAQAALREATSLVSGGLNRMRRALRSDGCPPDAVAMFEEGSRRAQRGMRALLDLALSDSEDAGVQDAGWDAQSLMAEVSEDIAAAERAWAARCGRAKPQDSVVSFEPIDAKHMEAGIASGAASAVAGGTFVLNLPGPTPTDFVTLGSSVVEWDPSDPVVVNLPDDGRPVTIDLGDAASLLEAPGADGNRLPPVFFLAAGPNEVRETVLADPSHRTAVDRAGGPDLGLTVRTPGGKIVDSITKDQEFQIRLVVPRQDGVTPDRTVVVSVATPHGAVDVPLTTTQTFAEGPTVRYDSQVLTWNADRGFFTFLEEALSDEFVGLYRHVDAENGDIATVQYGSLMTPVAVYETWVQRGIGNVETVFLDAAERIGAELDLLDDAAAAGVVDPTLAEKARADGQLWLDFIGRSLRALEGLNNDYERFFVGVNLARLLTSDPSTWNEVSGEPGQLLTTRYGVPGTSRRESEAIRYGLQTAEEYYDTAWNDAIRETVLRGYAVFAGVTGGQDFWILLHAGVNGLLSATGNADLAVPVTDAMGHEVGPDGVGDAAKQLALGVFLTGYFSTKMREGSKAVGESRAARDAQLRNTNDLEVGTYKGDTKVIVGTDGAGSDIAMDFPNGRPPNPWANRQRGVRAEAVTPSGKPLQAAINQDPQAGVGTKLSFPSPRRGDPPIEIEVGTYIDGGGFGQVYEVRIDDPAIFGEPAIVKLYTSSDGQAVYGEQLGEFHLARTQRGSRPIAYKRSLTAVLDGPAPRVVRQRLAGDPVLQGRIRNGEVPLEQVPEGVEFQWPSNRPLSGELQDAVMNLFDNIHGNGLIADDIKLSNLYFKRSGDGFEAGLLDPDLVAPAHVANGPVVERRGLFALAPTFPEGGGREIYSLQNVDQPAVRQALYQDPKLHKYYTAERHGFVEFDIVSRADLTDDLAVVAPYRETTDQVLVLTDRGRLDRSRVLERWPDIGQHRPDPGRYAPVDSTTMATDPAFTGTAPGQSFYLPFAERWAINLFSGIEPTSELVEAYKLFCGEGFRIPDDLGGGVQLSCTPLEDDPVLGDKLQQDPRVRVAEPEGVDSMAEPPNDPYFSSRGSWGQAYDDQWALKRIGLGGDGLDDWTAAGGLEPVTVAVIDTGLDYIHPDLDPASVWRNAGEIPNGLDDDRNGYVDDLIGWNFVDHDNNPWDYTGHGTHVAGIIAGAVGNGEGIAGLNPAARIMPLKVLNVIGKGRRTRIARAIYYAVDNGARIINLSLGGPDLSQTVQMAIDYAHQRDVLVVVAAGNAASETVDYNPVGLQHVLSVAATDPDDRRAGFSNWGQSIDLAAPGVDVLSLRARRTDFFEASGDPAYRPGSAFVGDGRRYMRGTGTSFAAPLVAGTASLLLSRNPSLSAEQVQRMLLMSADDLEVPGWDQYTGAGRLNAARAMDADPGAYLLARVRSVQAARRDGQTVIQVSGSAVGASLQTYVVSVGLGEAPDAWREVGRVENTPVDDGVLFDIPAGAFTARGQWTIRVVAIDRDGTTREGRGTLRIE